MGPSLGRLFVKFRGLKKESKILRTRRATPSAHEPRIQAEFSCVMAPSRAVLILARGISAACRRGRPPLETSPRSGHGWFDASRAAIMLPDESAAELERSTQGHGWFDSSRAAICRRGRGCSTHAERAVETVSASSVALGASLSPARASGAPTKHCDLCAQPRRERPKAQTLSNAAPSNIMSLQRRAAALQV